jgi:hypothetical protein
MFESTPSVFAFRELSFGVPWAGLDLFLFCCYINGVVVILLSLATFRFEMGSGPPKPHTSAASHACERLGRLTFSRQASFSGRLQLTTCPCFIAIWRWHDHPH